MKYERSASVLGDVRITLPLLSPCCFELPVAELLAGRMARGGNVAREKEIHATSDQGSKKLPGGQAADVVLHEVPLALQHHLIHPGN
jgi:hypothetical protein